MAFPHAAPAGNLNVNGDLIFSKLGSRIRMAFAGGARAEQRTIFTTAPGQTAVFGTMPGLGGALSAMQVYDRNLDAKDTRGFCYGDFRTGTGLQQVRITSSALGPDSSGTGAPAAYPICLFVNSHSHLFNTDGSLSFTNATWTVDASGNIVTPANVQAATMHSTGLLTYGSATGGNLLSTQVTIDAGGAVIFNKSDDTHAFDNLYDNASDSLVWRYDGGSNILKLQSNGALLTNSFSTGVATISSMVLGGTSIVGAGDNAVMQRIAQVVCASSQATISFSSIPAGFTNLMIMISGRDTKTTVGDSEVKLEINGDTTSGHYLASQYVQGGNAVASAGLISSASTGSVICSIPGSLNNANTVGSAAIFIPNYSGTTFYKTAHSQAYEQYGASSDTMQNWGFTWLSAAAINALLLTAGGTAFVNGTTATLYGMP